MVLAAILVAMVILLLTGLPIFAGLGLLSISLLVITGEPLSSVAEVVFGKLNIYLLIAIPLFAFMAHVMIRSKVVDDLYETAHVLVRHLPGGLGVATVLSCTIFAAISGSSVATALTIGASALPQMRRYGYRDRDAYGVIAAGGTLGILIPPSGPLILYGVITEVSIGALFIAGLIPGLILATMFAVYCMVAMGDRGREKRASMREALSAIRKAVWALSLPPVILGGLYFGVFTATEAAAAGSVLALFIATLVYKNFTWADLFAAAAETTRTTAMLFLVLAGAAIFAHVITLMGLPSQLVRSVVDAGVSPAFFLIAIMALVFVLGMFLETISIILVTTPIVLPVLDALGINPLWYGILLMINLEMALITPPVGMNLFVLKGIAQAPLIEIIRGALPYVGIMIAGLVLMFAFPELSLWLPRAMGYEQ
ncbi:MAG: TRAP transporter large permease [Alphaproteobacteria bacterium]